MSNGARIPDELARKFGDIEGRRQLMKDYGDKSSMFTGTNQDGEDVSISIAASGIIETVYQGNGRVRIDYYDESGYQTGSKYDGQSACWDGPYDDHSAAGAFSSHHLP